MNTRFVPPALRYSLCLLAGVLASAVFPAAAVARTLYWDMNNNFPGGTDNPANSASGTWNRTLTNWSTDIDGLANTGPWVDGSDAVFFAGTDVTAIFTITLGLFSPTVNSITVRNTAANFYGPPAPNNTYYTLKWSGNGEFNVGVGGATVYTLVLKGTSALTKTGSGALSFSGTTAQSYTGLTLMAGDVKIQQDSHLGVVPATPTPGNITLNGGALWFYSATAPVTLSANRGIAIGPNAVQIYAQVSNGTIPGIIADAAAGNAGTLEKKGNATLILSGNNSYSGKTLISSGILKIQSGNALGNVSNGTIIGNATTLQLDGGADGIQVGNENLNITGVGASSQSGVLVNLSGNNTWAGNVTLDNNATIASDAGLLTINGNVAASGSRVLTLGGAGAGALAGNIASSISGLTKNGTGTWTLSGTNNYTGATTLNAGRLLINGVQTGSAATVKAGATLGGQGTLGIVTMEAGGILAPGSSETPGVLSVSKLTLADTSIVNFEFGASVDRIAVTGNLTLDGILNITDLGNLGTGSYRLFDYGGTLSDNGLQIGSAPAGFSYLVSTAIDHQVNLLVSSAPVPEPALASLLLAGMAVLGRRPRRSNARSIRA